MMKDLLGTALLLFVVTPSALAHNVAMNRNGIAVAAVGGRVSTPTSGLILQEATDSQPSFIANLPSGINAFHDVAIDPTNDNLVFALDTSQREICSYTIADDKSLSFQNCVGGTFRTSPFCGISANDGTIIISGGTGGFTVYKYDTTTGSINSTPEILNFAGQGIIGHPDVVLINPTLAALSTDFNNRNANPSEALPRFGTQIASIDGQSVNFIRDFRIEESKSLQFDFSFQPSNFALVNAVYSVVDDSGTTTSSYMYTANGVMQVQNPSVDDSVVVIEDPNIPNDFLARTVTVNNEMKIGMFGGILRNSGGSAIVFMDLEVVDPNQPTFIDITFLPPDEEKIITSIGSAGTNGYVAYTIQDREDVIFFESIPGNAMGGGNDDGEEEEESIESLTTMLINAFIESGATTEEFDIHLTSMSARFQEIMTTP